MPLPARSPSLLSFFQPEEDRDARFHRERNPLRPEREHRTDPERTGEIFSKEFSFEAVGQTENRLLFPRVPMETANRSRRTRTSLSFSDLERFPSTNLRLLVVSDAPRLPGKRPSAILPDRFSSFTRLDTVARLAASRRVSPRRRFASFRLPRETIERRRVYFRKP